MNIYDFIVKTNKGEEKSLADYKGKVLIIVNTASKCGFTPQYKELQDLYNTLKIRALRFSVFPAISLRARNRGVMKKSRNSAVLITASPSLYLQKAMYVVIRRSLFSSI